MKFVGKTPITKGWSGERKYRVTDETGKHYLLRETDIAQRKHKAKEFHVMRQLEDLGLPMCRPVKLWWDEATVYSLQSWVEGEDLESVLPRLQEPEQYRLGLEAGRLLRIVHSITASEGCESWRQSYARKVQRTLERYEECPQKLPHESFFLHRIQQGLSLLTDRPVMLQHGDFHRGNLMLDQKGRIVVIDFQKLAWGDPWEEFDAITWDVQLAPAFARGRVDGYFEGMPPEDFWQLFSGYVCRGLLNGLAWAVPYGNEQVYFAKQHAENVWNWYSGGQMIPGWYRALGLRRGSVALQPHDPCWSILADACMDQLKTVLGSVAIDVRHVGSTAIRGIHAKPILDIVIGVAALENIQKYIPALEQHNIIFRGQDHPGQLLFVKGDFQRDTRTHHIHVVLYGGVEWENYLKFRDYLNHSPERAAEYDTLKLKLAQQYPANRGAYTAGKEELVNRILVEAKAWKKEQNL